MNIHRILPFAACIAFSLTAAGHGVVVTVHAGSMYAGAWDGSSTDTNNTLPASLPLDTSHTVTDGIASNTTAYQFNHSALLISVNQTRGTVGSTNTASRHTIPIEFSVDQDTPYSLSGFFNLSGANRIVYYAQLVDASAGNAVLFRNQQQSYNTPGQAFTLGEVEGDFTGPLNQFLNGSLNGTLLAGHHYKLEYNFLIQRTTTGPASASGQLLLQFGNIPEPASLALFALGTLAIAFHKRHCIV